MTWKAIFFDFNGVIINDERIHQSLIEEILLGENLLPSPGDYKTFCFGRNDKSSLRYLLESKGRFVSDEYLTKLMQKKSQLYVEILQKLEHLPIYDDIENFLEKLQYRGILIGLVTGLLLPEVEFILNQVNLKNYFQIIVTGEEITESKPNPEGYLLVLDKLAQKNPELLLKSSDCIVIEDSLVGIEAAKNAGMKVVGVANSYPFHVLQRQANWAVDFLSQLELKRIEKVLLELTLTPSI